MAILTSDDYEAIRKALDTELTDKNLPNSIIGLDIYAGAADQDVLDVYPEAESDAANAARITRAAVLFCAARLAPAVVRLTSLTVSTRDLSYQRPAWDPEKRAAELRALAEEELAEILDTGLAPTRPTLFGRAPGYRGQ